MLADARRGGRDRATFPGSARLGARGYTCGLLAREITGAAAVSLRMPPPLEHQLTLERTDHGRVVLRDGHSIIADAHPATLELDPPPPAELDSAEIAISGHIGFLRNPFPMCFACGPSAKRGTGCDCSPDQSRGET